MLLAALWLAITPWFFGGRRPVALLVTAMAVLAASFLLWRSPEPRKLGRGLLPMAYLGLLAWGTASLYWSINRFETAVWLIYLALAGVVFLLAYQLRYSEWKRRWMAGYVALAGAFSLWGLWIFTTTSYERLTSSFYWANPWAIWVLPAMLLAFWLWAEDGNWRYLPAAAASAAAFYLADSRSSFLILGIFLLAAIFKLRRRWPFWGRLLMAVGLSLMLAGVAQVVRERGGTVATAPGARLAELTGDSSSRTDRIYYLRSTWAIWRDHPLGGTGAGTFATAHPRYQFRVISAASHAHNLYAQTLSELGVVGLLLLLGVTAGLLLGALRAVRNDQAAWLLAVPLVLMVVHLGLDIDSAYPAIVLLLATVAGLVYRPAKLPDRTVRYPAWLAAGALLLTVPVASYYFSDLSRQAGLAWQDEAEYAEAANNLRKAHSYLVYSPDVLTEEGINRYTQGLMKRSERQVELVLARDRAERAARLDPRDAQHQLLLAKVTRLAGDAEAAEAAYLRAISLDPYNDPEYYIELAGFYTVKDRNAEALALLNTVIELYPDAVIYNRNQRTQIRPAIAHAHALRAHLHLLAGDTEAARRGAEESLRLNPQGALAQTLRQKLTAQ